MAESCKSKSDGKKVRSGSQTNCWGSEVFDSSQSGSGLDQQAGPLCGSSDGIINLVGLNGPVQFGSNRSPRDRKNIQKASNRLQKKLNEACFKKSGPMGYNSGLKNNMGLVEDGGQNPSGGGLPPKGHREYPAWICARGPFMEAHNDKVGLSGSYSFERFGEVGGWAVEEGNVGDCSLVLVDAEIRVPEEEAFEAHQSNANCSRYKNIRSKNSPSPCISVFGRPLLSGGSSGIAVFHGNDASSDMESLRMVSSDGREVIAGALLEVEQEVVSNGRQNKKLPCALPEWLGYKNWEDSCLIKFSEYLGVPTMRFEKEILELMRKMVPQQPKEQGKGN